MRKYKMEGHSHYILEYPDATQRRRFLAALVECRNWLGREQYQRMSGILRQTPRNPHSWRETYITIAMLLGMEGFVVHAWLYQYLGRPE